MTRALWALAAAGLLLLAAYLVVFRWADVGPNLEADVVTLTPAFVVHHVLLRRHIAQQHEQTQQALTPAPDRPPADH